MEPERDGVLRASSCKPGFEGVIVKRRLLGPGLRLPPPVFKGAAGYRPPPGNEGLKALTAALLSAHTEASADFG